MLFVFRNRHAGSEQVAFPVIGATHPLNHSIETLITEYRVSDQVYVPWQIYWCARLNRADEVVLPACNQHVPAAANVTADQASSTEWQFINSAQDKPVRSIVRSDNLRRGWILIIQKGYALQVFRPGVRKNQGQTLAVTFLDTELKRVIPNLSYRFADERHVTKLRVRFQKL